MAEAWTLYPRVIAIIPARAGSERVADKNMQIVGGRTLVQRAVDAARSCARIDDVYVSTEDTRIGTHAEECGAEWWLRPARLATGDASVEEVLCYHFRRHVEPWDAFVLLNPTSPFRSVQSIAKAVRLLSQAYPSVVGVVRDPMVHFSGVIDAEDRWVPRYGVTRPRTQDCRDYRENGAIFGVHRSVWLRSKTLITPGCKPVIMGAHESIDINTWHDLKTARALEGDRFTRVARNLVERFRG